MGFRKRGESPKGEYVRIIDVLLTACWAEAFGSVKAFIKKERKGSVQGSTALNQENSRLPSNYVQTHSVASLVESRGANYEENQSKRSKI